MKERPILFSTPMVQAVLDDRKTQTRRVVKPQPFEVVNVGNPGLIKLRERDECYTSIAHASPYGRVGDRLWVRETWACVPATAYRASPGVQMTPDPHNPSMVAIYRAGWERSEERWRPSIHMPRWASRITLEITGIRVERVQQITEEDAKAEGVGTEKDKAQPWPCSTHRAAFSSLWNQINGKKPGCSWENSPWVFVVSFKRVAE